MRKYLLLHFLIISFVFLLTPTVQAASDLEEEIESYKQINSGYNIQKIFELC